jgi:hypothetical protein
MSLIFGNQENMERGKSLLLANWNAWDEEE